MMISPFYQNRKNDITVHVFKTNIETELEFNSIKLLFDSNLNIKKWSIDLEDIDNVLRIESHKNINEEEIISLVKSKGFYCEELI